MHNAIQHKNRMLRATLRLFWLQTNSIHEKFAGARAERNRASGRLNRNDHVERHRQRAVPSQVAHRRAGQIATHSGSRHGQVTFTVPVGSYVFDAISRRLLFQIQTDLTEVPVKLVDFY